jgi:hypothetical protein
MDPGLQPYIKYNKKDHDSFEISFENICEDILVVPQNNREKDLPWLASDNTG